MKSPGNLMEGFFVRTAENLIFEIKGDVHPNDRVIAYLRYVPEDDNKFRKVYDLDERESYLQQLHPQYLWHSKYHGRTVQAVEKDCIAEILDPVEYAAELRKNTPKSELAAKAASLVGYITKTMKIHRNFVGITGSLLAGTATEESDIDLVVFGKDQACKLYSELSHAFEMIPELEQYSGERLQRHLEFRWGALSEYFDILRVIEKNKLLQGVFAHVDFFIRLVKLPVESTHVYDEEEIEFLGMHTARYRIVDSSNSIFTPCEYEVEALSGSTRIDKVVSYRGRFTEQARAGAVVNARGRLERVRSLRTGVEYHQVVLGESPRDFMIPV